MLTAQKKITMGYNASVTGSYQNVKPSVGTQELLQADFGTFRQQLGSGTAYTCTTNHKSSY